MQCPCCERTLPREFVGNCLRCGEPFETCDAWYLINDETGEWYHEGCRLREVIEAKWGSPPDGSPK